jgi:hypothetical protein
LEPVWGRLAYAAELVDGKRRVLYQGPAIVLEAVNPIQRIEFGKRLSADDVAELGRLKSDGHNIHNGDRNHTVTPTLGSCRATQLYRTFLHELGHWVDFLEKVERPATLLTPDEYSVLLDRFHGRTTKEKEQFAHRYAEQLRRRFVAARLVPFDRQLDYERLKEDSLLVQDFEFPKM